jgi:hypothetical protein
MTAQPPPQVPSQRNPAQDKGSNRTPVEFLPPLRPRPKLFIAVFILLICWLATIIVMRITTVHRDATPPTPTIAR